MKEMLKEASTVIDKYTLERELLERNNSLPGSLGLSGGADLNGKMLSHRLSEDVVMERCVPPVQHTDNSTGSVGMRIPENRFEDGEKEKMMMKLFPPLEPPLLKTKSQISRYEMFLRDNKDTLPNITK